MHYIFSKSTLKLNVESKELVEKLGWKPHRQAEKGWKIREMEL